MVWIPRLFIVWLTCMSTVLHADYSTHVETRRFIDEMVREHGFNAEDLTGLFTSASRQDRILEAISRPAEKTMPWHQYRQIFLGAERISEGVRFWRENQDALVKAQARLGVQPEYIVAIIGVETRYGANRGSYRVLDALSTLAFDYPPRSAFFRSELKAFLQLAREEGKPAGVLIGSYAGAMGYGQFIPSSYRHYAVDFDGDGLRDIWDNKTDAIGSVANYFAEHGWKGQDPVLIDLGKPSGGLTAQPSSELKPTRTLADLRQAGVDPKTVLPDSTAVAVHGFEFEDGPRLAIGFPDFYAITRYNHSILYARAVFELAQAIKTEYALTDEVAPSRGSR